MDEIIFVYLIKCNDMSFYTGQTNDARRRFDEHCGKSAKYDGAKFLRYNNKVPFEMHIVRCFPGRKEATKYERYLKKMNRVKKEKLIKKLVAGGHCHVCSGEQKGLYKFIGRNENEKRSEI